MDKCEYDCPNVCEDCGEHVNHLREAEQMTEIQSLQSELYELKAKAAGMEEALKDFSDNGCKHDLMPTLGGKIRNTEDICGWHGYLESMDSYVRVRAKDALGAR